MKMNVGSSDRYIRFMLGLGSFMNIFTLETGRGGTFIFLALGLVLWYSAFTSYCFVYDMLGICTCDANACECGAGEGKTE